MEALPVTINRIKRKLHIFFLYSVVFILSKISGTLPDTIGNGDKLYSINAIDIHGENVTLEKFKGKVLLIVNVATYCGFTQNHYKDLVKLQDLYSKSKFSVLAFPCNQFGEQEPDTNEEIDEFLRDVYKVNFPVFSKIEVTGENAHPLYSYLKDTSGKGPTWNFWKYLVSHKGTVLNAWGPMTSVESISDEIHRAVSAAEKIASEEL